MPTGGRKHAKAALLKECLAAHEDEDTDEEADGSGSDASEEEGSEGISGSEGSEDAEGAGEVLATGRHHDKAKYRVSWFFFSGTAVDVGNALGVAARHIDGNCAAHVDELMRQFEMPMPASDGWVFAEGERHAVAILNDIGDSDDGEGGGAGAPAKRQKGQKGQAAVAGAQRQREWAFWVEMLAGDFCAGSDDDEADALDDPGMEAARQLQHWLEDELEDCVDWMLTKADIRTAFRCQKIEFDNWKAM